jgi:hypothetical protein
LDSDLSNLTHAAFLSGRDARAEWAEKLAKMAIERAALKGLKRANKAQWLKPEVRVKARHLKAKGALRHATIKGVHPFLGLGECG